MHFWLYGILLFVLWICIIALLVPIHGAWKKIYDEVKRIREILESHEILR